ncbi:AAA domain-containing protein [Neobacillus bataviensis]|uniref:AAA domain-containing protein n=1 Tax=Neobacillus bataviensis TaxID=220685 RepID=UPI001CBB7205|nr:ATP-binding protein [Neobacillus bataviensis]
MEAKKINFGNEISINFTTQTPFNKKLEGELVDFQIIDNQLYLIENSTKPVMLKTENTTQVEPITHLLQYKKSSLIRIDNVSGKSLLLTIFTYPNVIEFHNNETFTISIQSSIELQLKHLNISKNNLSSFFASEFMVDGKCFVLTSKDKNKYTLVGERYFCYMEKTKQNIVQVVELRGRRLNSQVHGAITLLKGNIVFQDLISDKSQLTSETNKKFMEGIKDTHELLRLWELYSDLEIGALKQEVNELGYVKYIDAYFSNGMNGKNRLVFILETKVPEGFYQTSLGLVAVSEEHFNANDITASGKSVFLGDTIIRSSQTEKLKKNELCIQLSGDVDAFPKSGYIMGSFYGSKIMGQRREQALTKINDCKTPMVDLKLLLQTGESSKTILKHYQPINNELLKKIFGNKKINFTERQRKAIDIAINTPDIAIIQGPPGTGKTTVIRAIIARLGMIHKGDVKILVSSAQHDAVDNAIENVEYGGLPVNRLGGKLGDDENKANSYILKWVNDVSNNCNSFIEQEGLSQYRSTFRKISLLIEECRSNMGDTEFIKNQLISIYNHVAILDVEQELVDKIQAIITTLQVNDLVEHKERDDNSELSTLYQLLESQRVNKTSFMDDGPNQLAGLIRFLKVNSELEVDIPSFWMSLRLGPSEEELDELLIEFKNSLEKIKYEKFGQESTIYTDETLIEKDLNELFQSILGNISSKAEKTRDSVVDIIWEFKDDLENPQNISELISKYTKINAATCQQAVSKKVTSLFVNTGQIYDYVIIDEAARANPLDLLIPMSLGKKIILVGDQNQLPHLLENDVVEEVLKVKNDPQVVELLKEPLFTRLFNLLEESNRSSAMVKRTVMLKDQYRMHPVIGKFVSTFYKEDLHSAMSEEDKAHKLGLYNNKPVAWIDVPKNLGPEFSLNNQSKYRDTEVSKVMDELYKILEANPNYTVGIITFYKKQALKIQEAIETLSQQDQMRICVGTVDAFQGKEFDVVLLSTVRSNDQRDIRKRVGFLDSRNRLCVAFSRGKRLVIVVGDVQTVARDGKRVIIEELDDFYQLCKKEGYYE